MELQYIAVVVLILILFIYMGLPYIKKAHGENFDTYYNHDIGAQEVYEKQNDNDFSSELNTKDLKKISLTDAGLKAKYDWSKKDLNGYNVYDKYYENVERANYGDSFGLPGVTESDSHGYDSKFNKAEYANYRISDMESQTPIEVTANDINVIGAEKIRLVQKEY